MWTVQESVILSLLPKDQVDVILKKLFSKHQPVKKNVIIYHPNDPSEYVYLLKKGRVRLVRLASDGRQITLSILNKGMIFGEGDVLNESTYSHYAETIEPCNICYIHKQDFKKLLSTYDEINKVILNILYKHWKESQQKIEEIALYDVRTRLINNLYQLSQEYGKPYNKDKESSILIDMKISQEHMADFIASSRETVNRILKELKEKGMIDYCGRKILLKRDFFENRVLQ